ncbi:N-acetylmuramoyl-L-alanine amidase [Paenibacillus ginsengihumi]|uniref:N-acetylmuramoyl-L-alanine amidase n=1 Tax=Paenibacillus ginsengihumi TaxID=431596 RepID=UPI0003790FE0|nr:N-acetylmuramoyl-L-alanine amidase [Paenibacillus ginsengihumi]
MKIMIDAGHGGKDPGAIGNGLREKDLTLKLALRIGQLLAARGADVRYTRTDDTFVELSDRARAANTAKVDYFLSIHINAGGGTGFESFTYTGTSGATAALRNVIHRKVAAAFVASGLPDRGRKQANLAVLRETNMPAALLEYGFIDTAKDAALLKTEAFLEQIATATADGVAEAFGLPAAVVPAPVDTVSEWARAARDWAVSAGITDGTRPRDGVTREEVWTMLWRMNGGK